MAVTTNTRKLAALLGASGAGIGTDGTLTATHIKASGAAADLATQTELDSARHDLTTVALRQAIGDNENAYNLPSGFIDQFESDAAIGTQTNCRRQGAKVWETGDQRATYVATHNIASFAGLAPGEGSLNGVFATATGTDWYFNDTSAAAGKYIRYDLEAGNSKVFVGARLSMNSATTNGTWKWQGSQDGTTWTDLSANFNWLGQEVLWTNSIAYRFIQVLGISGNVSNGPWQQQTEFKVHTKADYVSTKTGMPLIGTLQFLGSAQDAVSGLDNGTVLTVNQTTGQIEVPTTIVESANTNVDNYTIRLDLGEEISMAGPLRASFEVCRAATNGSNLRMGLCEFNVSSSNNAQYKFHHNGTSGVAPTVTKSSNMSGGLATNALQEVVNMNFNTYEGWYADDNADTKWVNFVYSGSVTVRYLYTALTTTQGIPGTVRFTHNSVDFSGETVNATGTLIGTANVPSAAQTKVSGVMLYKDAAGTATLGTDLRIYFTCNGGTNWTEVLLADMTTSSAVFSTGVKMVRFAEKTCTSGSDIRYKAVWANQSASKETQLHGIGLNY